MSKAARSFKLSVATPSVEQWGRMRDMGKTKCVASAALRVGVVFLAVFVPLDRALTGSWPSVEMSAFISLWLAGFFAWKTAAEWHAAERLYGDTTETLRASNGT